VTKDKDYIGNIDVKSALSKHGKMAEKNKKMLFEDLTEMID